MRTEVWQAKSENFDLPLSDEGWAERRKIGEFLMNMFLLLLRGNAQREARQREELLRARETAQPTGKRVWIEL